jgi:hypothetical protein
MSERQPLREHWWLTGWQLKPLAHMLEVWQDVRHWPFTGSQV